MSSGEGKRLLKSPLSKLKLNTHVARREDASAKSNATGSVFDAVEVNASLKSPKLPPSSLSEAGDSLGAPIPLLPSTHGTTQPSASPNAAPTPASHGSSSPLVPDLPKRPSASQQKRSPQPQPKASKETPTPPALDQNVSDRLLSSGQPF